MGKYSSHRTYEVVPPFLRSAIRRIVSCSVKIPSGRCVLSAATTQLMCRDSMLASTSGKGVSGATVNTVGERMVCRVSLCILASSPFTCRHCNWGWNGRLVYSEYWAIKKRTSQGCPFIDQNLPFYSILALLRRSSIYFLIACCCRLFSIFGFISSSDGTFRSRVSSSLMMCQPYWVCTGTLV